MPPKAYTLVNTDGSSICSLMADGPDDVYTAVATIMNIKHPKFKIEPGNIVRMTDQNRSHKKSKASEGAAEVQATLPLPVPPVPVIPAIYRETAGREVEFCYKEVTWNFDNAYGGNTSGLVGYDIPYYVQTKRTPFQVDYGFGTTRIHEDAYSEAEINAATQSNKDRFVVHPDKAAIFDIEKKHLYVKGCWRPSIMDWAHDYVFSKKLSATDLAEAKTQCKYIRDSQVSDANARIRSHAANVENARNTLLLYLRNREADRNLVALLEKAPPVDIAGQLQRIIEMPIVKDVQLTNATLKVLVGPIEIQSGAKTYAIGLIQFTVTLGNGGIIFNNLTRKKNGRPHPHIQTNGVACWGEIQVSITDLLARWMLAELVTVVVRYLQSVDPKDSWGAGIVNWPEVVKPAASAATPSEVPVAAPAAQRVSEEDEMDDYKEEDGDIPF